MAHFLRPTAAPRVCVAAVARDTTPICARLPHDTEGISRLSEALGIDPTADVRILVLMWRLGAVSKPGQVSCDEFQNGMENVGCDTIESLVELAPSLDPGFLERSTFREFYKFVFQVRPTSAERGRRPHTHSHDPPPTAHALVSRVLGDSCLIRYGIRWA